MSTIGAPYIANTCHVDAEWSNNNASPEVDAESRHFSIFLVGCKELYASQGVESAAFHTAQRGEARAQRGLALQFQRSCSCMAGMHTGGAGECDRHGVPGVC